jgi:multidrug efflux pump subunit AcrB
MQDNQFEKMQQNANGTIGKMVGWLASNRTTVYVFTAIILLTGLNIYNTMPKEQFPDIVVPQMYIQTVYAGTTPADIENVINRPIEKQLKSVTGVKRVKSNALQDVSVILVEFNTDVEVPVAKQRVVDAVDKAKTDLPKDLTQDPVVQEVNFSEFPIMNINLAGNFPLQTLKNYAEVLQDEIEAMPEITRVDIVGALTREIQINADLSKMQAAGLTFGDIQMAVQGENVNISGGELNVDNVRRTLRVKGEFKDVNQIANLMVRSGTGATVRLSEVADVKDSFLEKQDYARLNNKTVVTLNVIKRAGSNLIAASDKIEATIERLQEDRFPQGLEVKVTADQSERTRSELNDLVNTVILGFIFVVLVLMFFMGVRDAIFVALSVPLSALVAFLFMPSLDFTLNTIVLFAFLLGLGIVVDDAIVVIENAHRIFNKYRHLSIVEAVKSAAGEVFIPVLTGTLTTISPFLPLLFWPGIVGEFMKFLPITLILTLFASLFVAYVINPVFAVQFMTRHEEGHVPDRSFRAIRKTLVILLTVTAVAYALGFGMGHFGLGNFAAFITLLYLLNHYVLTPMISSFQNGFLPRFQNAYRRLISWAITGYRPVGVLFGALCLLIFSFVFTAIRQPDVIFFPSGEPDYIYVYNKMPIGTDAAKTDSVTKIIEQRVFEVIKRNKAEEAVNSVISNVGKNAGDPFDPDRSATPHKSKVTVAFVKKDERQGISSEALLVEVSNAVKNLPGTEISVQRERTGPPTGKPISIEIAGEDFSELVVLEKAIRQGIQKAGIEGIEELKSDLVTSKPEITIDIDREKAQREGISSGQIGMAVRTALFGQEISKFRDNKDEYPIQLRLKPDDRSQIDRLLTLNIAYRDMNAGGAFRQVPLNSIADISYTTTFSQINRKNQQRVVTLGSEVVPGFNANEIVGQIQQQVLDQMDIPSGYTVKMGGEQEEQMESMQFLVGAFGLCIALIFLVLVTQFNSVTKPIIIFVTIVLSLIGVFLGFSLFNMTFSIIMSGVGIISLAGIVVKNGILLIEFTDELRERGYSLKEALVEAGAIRMTPVLLTASAAILGLIPLALGLNINFVTMFTELNPHLFIGGEGAIFWGILAWTIIFGLSFSTALTLIVVPCMYYINERLQERFSRKKKTKPSPALVTEEA